MFPWWLRNDLHLLFINIVSFQEYGLSEKTISGTFVSAFSLRSPPGFSPMVLSTTEGSHGWDNDSRWSFHEHTHHVDPLHGDINILPWTERFDKAEFISAEFYWQSRLFYSDITDSVAVPLVPSQQLWTVGRWTEELRHCPVGPGFGAGPLARTGNVELDSDLETFSQQSSNNSSIDFACHCLWCFGWLAGWMGWETKWST